MTRDYNASRMLEITPQLVRTLIEQQFPQWAALQIVPVEPGGWDNRTFRLGDDMAVRLPSAECYAAQIEKGFTATSPLAICSCKPDNCTQ